MVMITLETLEKAGACAPQLDRFEELFPNGVDMTPLNAVEYADRFSWGWGAENMLTRAGCEEYDTAIAGAEDAFSVVSRAAWKNWEEATKESHPRLTRQLASDDATSAAIGEAYAAYDAEIREQDKILMRAMRPARIELHKAMARTFATIYNREHAE